MKIVLAPDKFKSCMTAPQVCEILSKAICDACPDAEIVSLPMADGGDGTMRTMAYAMGAEIHEMKVTGPLGNPVIGAYAYDPKRHYGIVEMASASGIALVSRDKLNPLIATTYGTGELLRKLMELGAREILIGIGGSATVDGGAGMAQALGYRLLDGNGNPLPHDASALDFLSKIDDSHVVSGLQGVKISVACDVTSPLLGPSGSAAVFGPQKGATPEMVVQLEKRLAHLSDVWVKQRMINRVDEPGDGAAGGLGAGLRAFCKATPQSGAKLVMKTLNFSQAIENADFVVTGEGRTDSQTDAGKLCGEIAKESHRKHVPVILMSGALCGSTNDFQKTFDYAFSISKGQTSLDEALSSGPENLYHFAYNLFKMMAFNHGKKQ